MCSSLAEVQTNRHRERPEGARLGRPGRWPATPASPAGTKREGARLEWASRSPRSGEAPKGGYCPLYGIGGGEAINISPPVTCLTLACG